MGQELRVVACGYYASGAIFPPLAVDSSGKLVLSGTIAVDLDLTDDEVMIGVLDGVTRRLAMGDASGRVVIAGDAGAAAVPISAASLPLPAGAALETGGNLAAAATSLSSLDGKVTACDTSGLALETGGNLATLAAIDFALESGGNLAGAASSLSSIDGKITGCDTSGLALETGGNLASAAGSLTTLAAVDFAVETGGNLAAAAGSLSSIDGKITGCDTSGLALETGGNLATLAAVDFALESGGNLAACKTALEIMDDWDESNRAMVNVIVGQAGVAAGAGAVGATVPRVTLCSDDPAVASLGIMDDWDESDRAKVNPIAGQAGVQGASGAVTALTQRVVLATDVALPSGTNLLGRVTDEPQAANGCSAASYIGAASDNANVAKASAGNVYGIVAFNKSSTPVYLKLYNKATTPTNGDTPIERYMVPGNTAGAGFVIVHPKGVYCSAGISIRLVTGMADNDNTSPTASEQLINIDYK